MGLTKSDKKKIMSLNNKEYNDDSWDTQTLIQSYGMSQFTTDRQYLDSLINNALDAAISTGIQFVAIQLHGKRISDNDIKDIIEKAIKWVTDILKESPYEVFMVHKYFGEVETFYMYIADIITRMLYSKALELNTELDNKILATNNMSEISKLNQSQQSPKQNN